jgi:hypothetical protein
MVLPRPQRIRIDNPTILPPTGSHVCDHCRSEPWRKQMYPRRYCTISRQRSG